MNYRFLLLIFALSIFSFSSCEKEEEQTPTTNEEALKALEEYVLVNKLFSDAQSEAESAARQADEDIQSGNKNGNKSFPIITIEPFDAETWPKTVTVNFGEENFLCQDNRFRRGVIIFETTGFYHEEGTVITVNFDNYYQNDHKLEGTKIVTNEGRNQEQKLVYSTVINDGIVITPEQKSISYQEETQRVWVDGEDTFLDACDDVYMVSGSQSGISSDEINYTLTIIEDLDVRVCCHWVRAGVLNVDIETVPTISINYGDGECDNTAVITILGNEYPIIME